MKTNGNKLILWSNDYNRSIFETEILYELATGTSDQRVIKPLMNTCHWNWR
jgi:hypothetical protein